MRRISMAPCFLAVILCIASASSYAREVRSIGTDLPTQRPNRATRAEAAHHPALHRSGSASRRGSTSRSGQASVAHSSNASDWLGYRSGPPRVSAHDANATPPHLPFYVARKGRDTIYLLGTLHAGLPADYPAKRVFRPQIQSALDDSPVMAFELSPDDLVDAQAQVQRYGTCRYACLPKLISPSLWRKVNARIGRNPALLRQVSRMQPWLAALMIESYDAMSSGLQAEYGSEAQLQNQYLRGRIVGLETLHEQVDAFSRLSLAEQREMLEQDLVQSPLKNAADLRRVHALWREGNADQLAQWQTRKTAVLMRDEAASDGIDEHTLYARNQRFLLRIQALVAPRKPLFVAIGALHLGGRRGVLNLLRQAGYRVQAL